MLLLTVYLSPFLFAACLFALSDAAGCVTGRLYHAERSSLGKIVYDGHGWPLVGFPLRTCTIAFH